MDFDNALRLFACLSLVIGAIECFAGFKIMKAMLGICGFFIGSMIGVIIGVTSGSVTLGIIFVVILGVGIAVLAYKLYLAGVFILTAFMAAAAVYLMCMNVIMTLFIAVLAGAVSVFFVKPAVVVVTAFSGARIVLASAYMVMQVGIGENPVITAVLWMIIALAGIACQYVTTQKSKSGRMRADSFFKSVNPSMTFSERKYPGMQRAYRNFCIKCGCELAGYASRCPRCGFDFDDNSRQN